MERALATSRDRYEEPHAIRRRLIRLMIVDDSTVARAVLSRMIESDPAFEIAAVAATAEDAIDALGEVRVDIVILDLEMPGEGGLKLLPRIIAAAAGAKVMIVSTLAEDGAENTVAAHWRSAPPIPCPSRAASSFNGRFSEVLVSKLKALGFATASAPLPPQMRRVTGDAPLRADAQRPRSTCSRSAPRPAGSMRSACCSRRCRARSACRSSSPSICRPLSCRCSRASCRVIAQREALVAEDGMALRPDRILLAPGDAHLTLEKVGNGAVVRLTARPQRERVHALGRPDVRVGRRDLRAVGARRDPDRHGPRRGRGRGAPGRRRRRDHRPGRSQLGGMGNAARGARRRARLRRPAARQDRPPDLGPRAEELAPCK